MGKAIRGILFDLGDTLLDFGSVRINRLFVQGARNAYYYVRDLGKPLPSKPVYLLRQLWAVRWSYLKSLMTGREFDSLALLKRQAEKMGHPLSEPEAVELAWRFYLPLREMATIENDLHQTLAAMQRRGLKLGIVSNTFLPAEVLDRHLDEEDLRKYFDTRVYSCQVGHRKPHRLIFQKALELISLPAEEVMFVGDTPKEDVRGAKDMRMVTVLKDPDQRKSHRRPWADYTIGRIAQLLPILDGMAAAPAGQSRT
ncbi:MAG: HAD family hydrolase [Phycisphaerae bacterium]